MPIIKNGRPPAQTMTRQTVNNRRSIRQTRPLLQEPGKHARRKHTRRHYDFITDPLPPQAPADRKRQKGNQMNREQAIETIRSAVKCKDFLTKSKHGSYICPFCHSGEGPNRSGALKVYDSNTWTCHACGKSGDIIDLYRQEKGLGFNAALSELATLAGIAIDATQNAQKAPFNGNQKSVKGNLQEEANAHKTGQIESQKATTESGPAADYTEYYKLCRERLTDPAAVAYLNGRGIDFELAQKYGLGFDPEADPANFPGAMPGIRKSYPEPRLIIPASKSFYVARAIRKEAKYRYANPKDAAPAIFNETVLFAQDTQEVFVFEGSINALSIMTMGANAIALNSTSNARKLLEVLESRRTKATLIICPDNDNAGAKCAKELSEGLQRLNISHIIYDINMGYNDANEALINDFDGLFNEVSYAVSTAQQERERLRKEEEERRQRTGAAMVDSFLEAVQSQRFKPIPTGIQDIDNAIGGGLIRQQLILLGAAPGAGKTGMAQWLFEGMARKGHPCIFLNLEMSRDQMIARSITRLASFNGIRLRVTDVLKGYQWTPEHRAAIEEAAEFYKQNIAGNIVYNPEEVTTDLDSIMQYLEKEAARAKYSGNPAPLVCIDYLQIITGDPREDEQTIIKRAVSRLKAFAIEHNTVVFLIQAHNRSTNSRGEAIMGAGRGSSAIEYTADLQMSLNYTLCLRKNGEAGKAEEDLTDEEKMYVTLTITKGRFSKPGARADLIFDGETMQYKQRYAVIDGERWENGDYSHVFPLEVRKAGRKL